jgi:hypothetical protein
MLKGKEWREYIGSHKKGEKGIMKKKETIIEKVIRKKKGDSY